MEPLQILKDELFSKTKILQYKERFQGQKVTEDVVYIGDRAGPEIHISNLCHELAHFVEIDDDRMTMLGWGLKLPEVFIYDRMCLNPVTMQATERELRVIAYQKNLLDYLKVNLTIKELVDPCTWLPDYCFVPLEDGLPASEEIDGEHKCRVPFKEVEPSRLRYLKNEVEKMLPEYSLERFFSEFNRKIQIIG